MPSFIEAFPGDHSGDKTARQLPGMLYALARPDPVLSPRLVAWSKHCAAMLDLDSPGSLNTTVPSKTADDYAQIFSGNHPLRAMTPYATRYGGHQFGHWAGQLGDGRALIIGEIRNQKGLNFEIQLKGAGLTPFSRFADGRAVLRSSLREFLCSEAMHYLGCPTTRALSCVVTGDLVMRDLFYDGNAEAELGAITTRVAPSFLRLGHFEILAADSNPDLLQRLVDWTTSRFYPDIEPLTDPVMRLTQFYQEVCRRTFSTVLHWMRVGFVHGVMNSDNLSVLGLTMDYGPFGWMESFDPNWTPNTTDFKGRRYAFGNQGSVAAWNLCRFGESLMTLTPETKDFQTIIENEYSNYQNSLIHQQRAKMGLDGNPTAQNIMSRWKTLSNLHETDPTLFYRFLTRLVKAESTAVSTGDAFSDFKETIYDAGKITAVEVELYQEWLKDFKDWIRNNPEPKRLERMESLNPIFIMRNYLCQLAIDDVTQGRTQVLDDLMGAMLRPYEENSFTLKFHTKRPSWANNKPGCSTLSCSS